MPVVPLGNDSHREKLVTNTFFHSACIARPVKKNELEASPKAREARDKEWKRLWDKHVWDASAVKEWDTVAKEAREKGEEIHLGRLFGFCVEKGSELPDGDPNKKFKYRVVFQGNGVVNQSWE